MLYQIAAVSLSLLCAASAPLPTLAQDGAPAKGQTNGFKLEAGEHDIETIVDRAAKFLNRNYMFEAMPRGTGAHTVKLQKTMVLDVKGCEEVVSQLAGTLGYAIVPLDTERGLYEVISERGPNVHRIYSHVTKMTPEQVLQRSRLRTMVLTTLTLKHTSAQQAMNSLRPFFSRSGNRSATQCTTCGSQNSLAIQGYAPQVADAIRILRETDTLPSEAYQTNTKSIQSLYRRIAALTSRLNELEGIATKRK